MPGWTGHIVATALGALVTVAMPMPSPARDGTFAIASSAFAPDGSIPSRFTCDGAGRSPPLGWIGVPSGARSLALIVDDPDAPDPAAPQTTWVHWVLYDIPPGISGLPEGASAHPPKGARQGRNGWGKTEWGGPCPPVGRHRYFFKLYALDTTLTLDRPTEAALESAMKGHIIGQAQMIGTYAHR
jgi:Raf kinase inhibitor-like YbhB/YbcL family protein